jgi:hypothetical protein
MAYTSTAKQRLWLSCLGYCVSTAADDEEVRALFDDARASGRYQQPANHEQLRLSSLLGVRIGHEDACGDAAGKLYQVLLCRAWVFSVWRVLSGTSATNYAQTGLSDTSALAIAREMAVMDLASQLEKFATTDAREGDVFYRMSKKAQNSRAFQLVSERLRMPVPDVAAVAVQKPDSVNATPEVMPADTRTVRCPKCQAAISFLEQGLSQRVVCGRCRTAYRVRRRPAKPD